MIPYDDLVAALSNWRAKQGLPGGSAAPAPVATAPSAPASKSGPKTAPPRSAPQPAVTYDDPLDVDEAALLEEASYGDYGGNEEATSIGGAPQPGDATLDEPMPGSKSGPKKQSW